MPAWLVRKVGLSPWLRFHEGLKGYGAVVFVRLRVRVYYGVHSRHTETLQRMVQISVKFDQREPRMAQGQERPNQAADDSHLYFSGH